MVEDEDGGVVPRCKVRALTSVSGPHPGPQWRTGDAEMSFRLVFGPVPPAVGSRETHFEPLLGCRAMAGGAAC